MLFMPKTPRSHNPCFSRWAFTAKAGGATEYRDKVSLIGRPSSPCSYRLDSRVESQWNTRTSFGTGRGLKTKPTFRKSERTGSFSRNAFSRCICPDGRRDREQRYQPCGVDLVSAAKASVVR